jgi:D-ribulokinase
VYLYLYLIKFGSAVEEEMNQDTPCVIGVDVGTGSVRAAVVEIAEGKIVASHTSPINVWNPSPQYYEQSSTDIWNAVCICVKTAVGKAGVSPAVIKGIAFDATCSL